MDLILESHWDICFEEWKMNYYLDNLSNCRDKWLGFVLIWALNKRKIERVVVDSNK